MELTNIQHITITPGLRGGKPHIIGRRITVSDVAMFHLTWGWSIEEISREYDLSLAEIYAALAYYYDNREEIDKRMAADEAFAEEMERKNPSRFAERLKKLRSE